MKSILYAGATLMIGASIYGFVDYKQTSQKEEFRGMYEAEKKAPSPEVITTVSKTEVVAAVVPEVKRTAIRKKSPEKSASELAPVKPIPGELKMEPGEISKIEEAEVTVIPNKPEVTKKSKKKKLNSKLFSRAPIREEREDLVLSVEETKKLKKESKKD